MRIAEFSKKMGLISLESAVAVGDNFNDVEMLEYAPYSVVLGHAHEDVKKFADHVTEDNDYAVVHMGLIEGN